MQRSHAGEKYLLTLKSDGGDSRQNIPHPSVNNVKLWGWLRPGLSVEASVATSGVVLCTATACSFFSTCDPTSGQSYSARRHL